VKEVEDGGGQCRTEEDTGSRGGDPTNEALAVGHGGVRVVEVGQLEVVVEYLHLARGVHQQVLLRLDFTGHHSVLLRAGSLRTSTRSDVENRNSI
jgi:hypothetical protein